MHITRQGRTLLRNAAFARESRKRDSFLFIGKCRAKSFHAAVKTSYNSLLCVAIGGKYRIVDVISPLAMHVKHTTADSLRFKADSLQ